MNAIRRCLEECDVAGIRALWLKLFPHLPQPRSDADALTAIHRARTEANSIPLRLRAYSHRWLLDRRLPSGLPDHLKPKAERLYPKIAESVGISVGTASAFMRPLVVPVREAMEHAVLDAYADGRKEPAFVRARMIEARDKVLKRA